MKAGWIRALGLAGMIAVVAVGLQSSAASDPATWQGLDASDGDPASLADGWTSAEPLTDSHAPAVRVGDDRDVLLRGSIFGSDVELTAQGGMWSSPAFRLPCDARPDATTMLSSNFVAVDVSSASPTSLTTAVVTIDTEGNGYVMLPDGPAIDASGSSATTSGVVTLDGLVYEAGPDAATSPCDFGALDVIWIAPSGNDVSGAGTEASPLASLARAAGVVEPGQTIRMKDGVYELGDTVAIHTDGTPTEPITLEAAPSAEITIRTEMENPDPPNYFPMLDFHDVSNWDVSGFVLEGGPSVGLLCTDCTAMTFHDLEVRNQGDHGIDCESCAGSTFERIESHHNDLIGLKLAGEGTADNLVINSDFHDNADEASNFENADGLQLGARGTGNQIVGNRSWRNADDGIDVFGSTDAVTITGNWSFENGDFNPDPGEGETYCTPTSPTHQGDGSGFKLGGTADAPAVAVAHVVANNLAWRNAHNGFTSNGNPGELDIHHNTGWANCGRGFNIWTDSTPVSGDEAIVHHNLSYENMNVATGDSGGEYVASTRSGNINSWDLTEALSDSDFEALEGSEADGTASRQSDGSLPSSSFLHLVSTSPFEGYGAD